MIEHLVKYALKYRLTVLIAFLAVCVLGSWALVSLPIDAFPDISPNLVQVFGEVDGMAAEEIEQLVSRPIEVAMMGLPGVKTVRSGSAFGLE